jgi:AcrR family transcriptional regulator
VHLCNDGVPGSTAQALEFAKVWRKEQDRNQGKSMKKTPIAPRKQRSPLTQVEVGERRRAATRATVLEAAFRVLGRGIGQTVRVEDVCAEARVVRTTFYNHFDTVEHLLQALTVELSHDFNTAVHRHTRTMHSIAAQVATAVRLYLRRAQTDPEWGRAMVNISFVESIMGHETYRVVEEDIVEGMRTGIFRISSRRLGTDLVNGLGIAAMISILRGNVPENYAEEVAIQILIGLGLRKQAARRIANSELPTI